MLDTVNVKNLCFTNGWRITKLVCLAFVIFQTSLSIKHRFYSGKTVNNIAVTNLDQIEFPFFLTIFVKPGFNKNKLSQHGYGNVFNFFLGQRTNSSSLGWTGKKKISTNESGE